MAKKKVTTTTTVTEEIIDDTKKPFHAVILVDNSGSMTGWQDRVASGSNEYVETLLVTARKEGFEATVSVLLFDTDRMSNFRIITLRDNVDVKKWNAIGPLEIVPDGFTPLYEAVYTTITRLDDIVGKDKALVVITDGGENSSRVTAHQAKQKIEAFQKAGHLMIYLGANQDAWAVGGGLGVSATSTATYDMSKMAFSFSSAGAATARYASTRSVSAGNFTTEELAGMTNKPKASDTAKAK